MVWRGSIHSDFSPKTGTISIHDKEVLFALLHLHSDVAPASRLNALILNMVIHRLETEQVVPAAVRDKTFDKSGRPRRMQCSVAPGCSYEPDLFIVIVWWRCVIVFWLGAKPLACLEIADMLVASV